MTDVPDNFKRWVADNAERIGRAKSLPYFLRDNGRMEEGRYVLNKFGEAQDKRAAVSASVSDAIGRILAPREKNTYAAIEPFSPVIKEYLEKRRDKKDKISLFNGLLNDKSFEQIHISENGRRTVLHPLHKIKNDSWENTRKMAQALNTGGRDVIFLPEHHTLTGADALTIVKGMPRIVDFKYCTSTKWNTLQKDLAEGFMQASAVVLKLENMDAGQFREAIEYMKRNKLQIGDIVLLNEYNKVLELSYNDFRYGKYRRKIKGFL